MRLSFWCGKRRVLVDIAPLNDAAFCKGKKLSIYLCTLLIVHCTMYIYWYIYMQNGSYFLDVVQCKGKVQNVTDSFYTVWNIYLVFEKICTLSIGRKFPSYVCILFTVRYLQICWAMLDFRWDREAKICLLRCGESLDEIDCNYDSGCKRSIFAVHC